MSFADIVECPYCDFVGPVHALGRHTKGEHLPLVDELAMDVIRNAKNGATRTLLETELGWSSFKASNCLKRLVNREEVSVRGGRYYVEEVSQVEAAKMAAFMRLARHYEDEYLRIFAEELENRKVPQVIIDKVKANISDGK